MKTKEGILVAAKTLASAAVVLMESALTVQRELVAQEKVNKFGCRICTILYEINEYVTRLA